MKAVYKKRVLRIVRRLKLFEKGIENCSKIKIVWEKKDCDNILFLK